MMFIFMLSLLKEVVRSQENSPNKTGEEDTPPPEKTYTLQPPSVDQVYNNIMELLINKETLTVSPLEYRH